MATKKVMTNEMAKEIELFLTATKTGVVGARLGARIAEARVTCNGMVDADNELDWEDLQDEIVSAMSVVEDDPNEMKSSLCLIYHTEMDAEIGFTDGRMAAWRKLGGYHLEDGEGFFIPTRLCKAIVKWGKYGVKMADTDEGMVFIIGDVVRVDATACPRWDCDDADRTGGWHKPKEVWEELRYKSASKMFMDSARLPIAMPSRKDSYPKDGLLYIADNGLWVKVPKERTGKHTPPKYMSMDTIKTTYPITYINADGSKDAAEGVATLRIEDAVACGGMCLNVNLYNKLAIFSGYGLGAPLFLNPNPDAGYSTLGNYFAEDEDSNPDYDNRGNLGCGVVMWMVEDPQIQKNNVGEAEENANVYRSKIRFEEAEKASAANDGCEIAFTTRKEANAALADANNECRDGLKIKYRGDFEPIEDLPSVDSELYAAMYKDVVARDKVDARKDVNPNDESDVQILMFEDKISYFARGMYFAAERRDAPLDMAEGEQVEIPRGLLRGMAKCGGEIGICNLAKRTEDSYHTRGWMVWQLGSYMQVGVAFGLGHKQIMTHSLKDLYTKWHAAPSPDARYADALLGIVSTYKARLRSKDILLVMPSGNVFATDWNYKGDKTIYIGKIEALGGMSRPYAVNVGYLKSMFDLCSTQWDGCLRLRVHEIAGGGVDHFTIEAWDDAADKMVDVPFTCGCTPMRRPSLGYQRSAIADGIVAAMRTAGIEDERLWSQDVAIAEKWGE